MKECSTEVLLHRGDAAARSQWWEWRRRERFGASGCVGIYGTIVECLYSINATIPVCSPWASGWCNHTVLSATLFADGSCYVFLWINQSTNVCSRFFFVWCRCADWWSITHNTVVCTVQERSGWQSDVTSRNGWVFGIQMMCSGNSLSL